MRVTLQKLREKSGFSQQTFSEAIHISRSHYSQIETGEKNPSLQVSLKIKRILQYHNDDLFFNHQCPVTGQTSSG